MKTWTKVKKLKIKDISLQKRIIINHIVLIIIPVVFINFFIFNSYTNDKKRDAISLIHQSSKQTMNNIDNYIMEMEQLTKSPLYESENFSVLEESNRITDPNLDYINTVQMEQKFSKILNKILMFNENIYAVFIFNLNGKNVHRITTNGLYDRYVPVNEEWFKESISKEGKFVVKGCRRWFNDVMAYSKDSVYTFLTSRSIENSDTGKTVGVISIFSDKKFLKKICEDIRLSNDEIVFIIDNSASLVYDLNEVNLGKSIEEVYPEIKDMVLSESYKENEGADVKVKKNDYFIDIVNSEFTTWKLVRLITKEAIYSEAQKIQQRFLLITLIFVFSSLLLSIVITDRLNVPVRKLIDTMKKVENGDLSARFDEDHNDEIGRIGRSFNKMVEKIDNLVNIVHVTEIRKKEADMNFLQAQINPHFIYNTLESIKMMAEINDDVETAKMVMMLGKLLRYSTNVQEQVVTLKKEIEYLENYLSLQNMRFDNRFELRIDIDEKMLYTNILKLVFQPIIENSINYGFDSSRKKCIITLVGYYSENNRIFEIWDNGKGIKERELIELKRKLENVFDYNTLKHSDNLKGKGIGLMNVNERIKLFYGKEYGISINSEYGKWTKVTVIISKTDGGKNDVQNIIS